MRSYSYDGTVEKVLMIKTSVKYQSNPPLAHTWVTGILLRFRLEKRDSCVVLFYKTCCHENREIVR